MKTNNKKNKSRCFSCFILFINTASWVFSSSMYSDRPVCAYYNHMYVCLQHHTYVDCFD